MELIEKSDNIFLVYNFLSPSQCSDYIKFSEQIVYEEALVETEKGFKCVEGTRNNDRILYTNLELAEQLFATARPFIPTEIGKSKAVGLNELFRFYRYTSGQKFKSHQDQSFIRNEHEASYYTFMLYLNDDFEGGATIFENCAIEPKQGSLLIFLHQLTHEGSEITKGIKYVLRTDVMYQLNTNEHLL
jgi:prolyl 4-hydroxylase